MELHCETTKNVTKVPCPEPTINGISDLQMLYPDGPDGIGKFEGEYHIVTDPDVPPVIHAPRKCPIHMKDDIKKNLDEMISLGVIKAVTEPTDWVSCCLFPNVKWKRADLFRS